MISALDDLQGSREAILAAAQRRGARSLRVFGSVARGDATPDSDVDLLVVFEPGSSLLDQVHLMAELEALDRDAHLLAEAVPL